jgi:4-amino-4-deoxy-L-arabinose transferase-like glycosyltransferase
MRRWSPLNLILPAYLLIAVLFARYTPDWQAPDEPAHYNYIRQLASGHLPVIEPSDYDQEYMTLLVFESHFAPQYAIEPLEYEDWQPPLYYLLQTPLYWLSGGSLLAMRIFSLLLGAGVIATGYAICLRLFPTRRWLAVTAAVFIAFLPQHISVLASVNNDGLAELLIGVILWLLINWLQLESQGLTGGRGRRLLTASGVMLGLGFLTKGTVYPLAILVGLVLLQRFRKDWHGLLQAGLALFLPAMLLGSLWWGRNVVVYGGFDILGKAAHDSVVHGQPRTDELIANVGLAEAMGRFWRTTFNSFWGQFGWMTVPLPGWVYRSLLLFSGLVLTGLALAMRQRKLAGRVLYPRPLAVLAGLFVLTLGVHVGYNFTFEQHQGRYLFPALIPIGVGVAVGLDGWARLARRYYSVSIAVLPVGLALLFIGLDLWALFQVIVPALS